MTTATFRPFLIPLHHSYRNVNCSNGASATIFESGLSLVFPNIESSDFPPLVTTTRLTPDGGEYWIAGLFGQVSRVSQAELKAPLVDGLIGHTSRAEIRIRTPRLHCLFDYFIFCSFAIRQLQRNPNFLLACRLHDDTTDTTCTQRSRLFVVPFLSILVTTSSLQSTHVEEYVQRFSRMTLAASVFTTLCAH